MSAPFRFRKTRGVSGEVIPGRSFRKHFVIDRSTLIEAAERDLTRSMSLPEVMSQIQEQRVSASKAL
tara:strand:+ start:390 stop:590 length:201 start_codon:yes stop_codon:yes gene_type:complete